ncbi:MAG: hypothetical protein WA756_10440, partial [Pseudolabrys sp.]
ISLEAIRKAALRIRRAPRRPAVFPILKVSAQQSAFARYIRHHRTYSLLDRLANLSCWCSFLLIFSLAISSTSNLIIIRRSLSPVDESRSLR